MQGCLLSTRHRTAPTLHPHCTHTAPTLHPHCTALHRTAPHYIHTAPHCTHTAPTLHPHCTHTAPALHPHCTRAAPALHPRCTHAAPHCTHTAPTPHHTASSCIHATSPRITLHPQERDAALQPRRLRVGTERPRRHRHAGERCSVLQSRRLQCWPCVCVSWAVHKPPLWELQRWGRGWGRGRSGEGAGQRCCAAVLLLLLRHGRLLPAGRVPASEPRLPPPILCLWGTELGANESPVIPIQPHWAMETQRSRFGDGGP